MEPALGGEAGEAGGKGGFEWEGAELAAPSTAPPSVLSDGSFPLRLGMNPEGFVLQDAGDSRILAGINKEERGFSRYVTRVSCTLPVPEV